MAQTDRTFYWRWFVAIFHYREHRQTPWKAAATVATALSIVVPFVARSVARRWFPSVGATVNDLAWQVPIGVFGVLLGARFVMAPYWIYRDSEKEREALDHAIAAKNAELLEARERLGRCEINLTLNKVYIFQLRQFLGFVQKVFRVSANETQYKPMPHYMHIENVAHIVIDITLWNEGGLPTTIENPQLIIAIGQREFAGKFIEGVTGCYVREEFIFGHPETLDNYWQPAIDIQITHDNPLVRGNRCKCWLHFAVESLPPVAQKDALMHLRFNDGLDKKYDHTELVEIINTEIHFES